MTLSRPLRQAQGRLCRTDRDSALVADLFQRVLSKSADRKKVNLDNSGSKQVMKAIGMATTCEDKSRALPKIIRSGV